MSLKEENIERVEKYLREELSADERLNFEKELSDNRELRETLAFVRDVRRGIEINTLNNLKFRLQKVEKRKGGFRWLAIAASVALIATVGYLAIKQTRSVDTQAIYKEFYSPYPNVVAPTSRSASASGLKGFNLYDQGKYEDALEVFSRREKSDTVKFYMAQTLLAMGNDARALAHFSSIDGSSNFSNAAHWYEALIYLKQKQKDKAVAKLDEIIAAKNDYSEKAKKVKELL